MKIKRQKKKKKLVCPIVQVYIGYIICTHYTCNFISNVNAGGLISKLVWSNQNQTQPRSFIRLVFHNITLNQSFSLKLEIRKDQGFFLEFYIYIHKHKTCPMESTGISQLQKSTKGTTTECSYNRAKKPICQARNMLLKIRERYPSNL